MSSMDAHAHTKPDTKTQVRPRKSKHPAKQKKPNDATAPAAVSAALGATTAAAGTSAEPGRAPALPHAQVHTHAHLAPVDTHTGTDASGSATLSDRLNPTHPAFDAALKESWSKMTRSQKKKYVDADAAAIAARHARVEAVKHPFDADENDHCETSPHAYTHVAPLLHALARALGRTPAELRIYDPYYCTGSVKTHLGALGFSSVYNECEDFYAAIKERRTPEFDVLLTNPAYSGTHIPRLLRFVMKSRKPFALLMPTYVAGKDYFCDILGDLPVSYIVPSARYVYWAPTGLRSKQSSHASALGGRTSPFISMWYIHAGSTHDSVLRELALDDGARLSRSIAELPKAARPSVHDTNAAAGEHVRPAAAGDKRGRDKHPADAFKDMPRKRGRETNERKRPMAGTS